MKIRIRALEVTDADDVHAILQGPEGMLETARVPTTTKHWVEEKFLRQTPERHMLAAEIDGRVVGFAGLDVMTNPKMRHCATYWTAVRDDFRGKGIGGALLDAIIDLADKWLGLVRLELHVNETNARGIALYRKKGFVEEGRLKAAILRDGRFVDTIVMGRVVAPPAVGVGARPGPGLAEAGKRRRKKKN
jgi:L-phenylalanine/L-methionine N-acetyltransferase